MGLKEGSTPTFSQVKEAFKEKLVEHPEQGGDTSKSQEIADATRVLLQFLVDNPREVDFTNSEEEDKDLLKEFEKSAEVKYNKGSVAFKIEEDKINDWTKSFTEYFGFPGETKESDHILFNAKEWSLPLKEEEKVEGAVTVHIYPGTLTVLVQGKLYLSFTTLVLPRIANILGRLEAEARVVKDVAKEK